jgi:hypothetical protein
MSEAVERPALLRNFSPTCYRSRYYVLADPAKAAAHSALAFNAFDAQPCEPKLNQLKPFRHPTYFPLWTSYSTRNGFSSCDLASILVLSID